ncbi:TPM domain-containing protein [Nanchangia anserum]|uniref:TPM domain-containing protein n=1 Tax=Nanchangia anserum TaxID=2692125 RepID=A0A8I0G8F6_9ACTO|nr:TPM domain-containing protein [Nanchangia anserum]MBD3689820.1 TPM domain-containing protein [Nanchangia anserum]QOX81989.1 TPM domain-containing protein [Nanchangia anserum]
MNSPTPSSRFLARLGTAGAIAGLAWCAVTPAVAESPVDSGGQRVVDHSGRLSSNDIAQAQAATDGTELYAVYVNSFDGLDRTRWCVETAQRSRLDTRAVLLVVATDDRDFDLCAGSAVELGSSERHQIADAARGELSDNKWSGATVAAARELKALETSRGDGGTRGGGDSDSESGGHSFVLIGALGLLVIAGAGAYIALRKNRRAHRAASSPAMQTATTAPATIDEATRVIVEVDDHVRQAREDLDFASAELGEAKVGPFEQALRDAETHRDKAWQLLRDAQQTGNGAQRDRFLRTAIDEANAAGAVITRQSQAFAQARKIQERAGDDLAAAERLIMDARRSQEMMSEELQRLHHDFPHTSFTSLDDNPDQADRLLTSAEHTLASGKQAWAAGDRDAAIAQLTLTQRAITQADNQIRQVMEARATLGDVNKALLREISALGSDLDDAARLAKDSEAVRPLVAEAHEAIATANAAREGQGDPLAAMERMIDANAALDEVLDPLREAEATTAKAQGAVRSRMGQVERRVSEAEAYISAHRGAVGAVARERANHAHKLLDQARDLVATDPKTAEQTLHEADALASQAQAIAEQDVARGRDDDFGADSFSWDSHHGRGGTGIDVGSLILGGLLFGGGGGHSSSWGGQTGGFGGGSFGGGGGFSGGFSGGFGGGRF